MVRQLTITIAAMSLSIVSLAAPTSRPSSRPVPAFNSPDDLALADAAQRGDLATVKEMVGAGANVNATHANGGTPFLLAVRNNRSAVAHYLLDHGARVDAHDRRGTV